MRKSMVLLAGIAFITSACASTLTEHFPRTQLDPAGSASVTIYRTGDLVGGGVRMEVLLDGYPIAKLAANSHVAFSIAPGQHSVGTNHSTTSLAMQAGEAYYFQVDMDINGSHSVVRVPPDVWAERSESSKAVQGVDSLGE